MSNKQLPPELVDKYFDLIDEQEFEYLRNQNGLSEQCAQIAVDYCFETFVPLNQQLKDLKQHRDELIYFIKLIHKDLDSGDMRIPLIRSTRRVELYELLKKHES